MQIYYLIFKMHVISMVCKVHKGKKEYYKNSVSEGSV